MMGRILMTRKEMASILRNMGIENPFTLRIVTVCGEDVQEMTIKDWTPNPKAGEIESHFKAMWRNGGAKVLVSFKAAAGIAMVG